MKKSIYLIILYAWWTKSIKIINDGKPYVYTALFIIWTDDVFSRKREDGNSNYSQTVCNK